MKYLFALLLSSTTFAGLVDAPDPVARVRAECDRRCNVWSEAQQRSACVDDCAADMHRAERRRMVPHTSPHFRAPLSLPVEFRVIADEDARWMAQDRAARGNVDGCENPYACAAASLGACGDHPYSIQLVIYETDATGASTCTSVCRNRGVFRSTCLPRDEFGCRAADYEPCGRCWTGPPAPGQCEETACDMDPGSCS